MPRRPPRIPLPLFRPRGPAAAAIAAFAILAPLTMAHDGSPPQENRVFSVEKITERISCLYGQGGNIGVYTGDEAVLVIDDQVFPIAEGVLAEIRKISGLPIRYVVNTHYHGDHTGGNFLIGKGAEIIGHETMRENFLNLEGFHKQGTPVPPNLTYRREMTLWIGEEEVRIFHLGRGHTGGDSVVSFPRSKVVHMGDLYFHRRHPFIDVPSGASVREWIAFLDGVLERIDPDCRVIPGHGSVSGVDGLREFRAYLADLWAQMEALVDQEMWRSEAISEIDASAYEDWEGGEDRLRIDLGILYDEIQAERKEAAKSKEG